MPEITPFMMYWIVKLDDFQAMFGIGGGCILGLTLFFVLFTEEFTLRTFFVGFVGLLFIAIATFIPTTKQLAAIYVVPPIINDERVHQLPSDLLDLGIEWIDELKPNKGE